MFQVQVFAEVNRTATARQASKCLWNNKIAGEHLCLKITFFCLIILLQIIQFCYGKKGQKENVSVKMY